MSDSDLNKKICQSCGIPHKADPMEGGTNLDGSKSEKYCSFCFEKGQFKDGLDSLEAKIEQNVKIAMEKFGMPEVQAREKAETILPTLDRWIKEK